MTNDSALLRRILSAGVHAVNKQGSPVVEVPVDVWDEVNLQKASPQQRAEYLRVLLDEWQAEPPNDDASLWDQFDAELKAQHEFELEREREKIEAIQRSWNDDGETAQE